MNSNWTARWFFVLAPFTLLCSGADFLGAKNTVVQAFLMNNDNSHSVYHSSFQLDLYSHGLIGNFCSCTLSSLLNNKAASYSVDRLIENNLKRGFGGGEVVLSLRPPLDSSASAFDLY